MNFKKRINGSWVDTPNYIHNTSTDTITTLPAVVYANGTTATVGLKGQTVQSSIPSPTSPIMPQGTGEKTGNLFDKAWFNNNTQLSLTTGLPIEYVGRIAIVNPIDVSNIDAVTLTYSLGTTVVENFVYSIFSGNTLIKRVAGKKSGDIIDVTNADTLYICLYIGNTNITVTDVQWIMLNTGSTALPYEPYGYKIPISSANTTTPVYLGEVETTRKIKKLVLTGKESWSENTSGTNTFRGTMPLSENNMNYTPGFCTHVEYVTTGVSRDMELVGCLNSNIYLRLSRAIVNTLADFKTYLQQQYAAGTPVTVWYVLATEQTAVVNEPLMKIGDYADTLSNVSIPVTAGGDTLSVGTTVQPSEVTVGYKGWHPVQSVHERTNGQWD